MRKFTQEEINEKLDTLATGNILARKYAKQILGSRRRGIFHQVLEDNTKATRLRVNPDELAQMKAIPKEDYQAIAKTWVIASDLWIQYRKLVYKLARKFATRVGIENKLDDLIGEASVAFMKAVRGYDNREFSFSAYFGMAVNTEMRRWYNAQRGFGGDEKLLIAYEKKWQELANAGEPHTFDDVVAALGLDGDYRQRLLGTLQEPKSEWEMGDEEVSGGLLANMVADDSVGSVDYDLILALESVELSLLERDSWITRDEIRELFPTAQKTMKLVAKQHEVTPQAAAFAAIRANSKIAAHLARIGYEG
jgi:hypothetical protein